MACISIPESEVFVIYADFTTEIVMFSDGLTKAEADWLKSYWEDVRKKRVVSVLLKDSIDGIKIIFTY